mmetsp:Transcript_43697/g.83911  ORF Transcript_43697/g.83911 Transcript_43697/m.83911 type:complete len:151 (-) Transcript_43697:148-600(-)
MDRAAAAFELAKLAAEAGKPELAKFALEQGLGTLPDVPSKGNAPHGMRLDLSQCQLPKETAAESAEDIDAVNTARTWQHYELEASDMDIQEPDGGVDTVNLLPVTPGSSRTAKRRFRRQRVRQKLRLLEQFPQLTPRELQCHQRLKLLEE